MQQTGESRETIAEKEPRHRRFRNAIILVTLALLLLTACVLWVNSPFRSLEPQQSTNTDVLKAGILDGLWDKEPNPTMIESVTQYLSNAGYTVDVYRGKNVTIDLLRNLSGYKVLIMRLHSSIHVDNFLYLFSGEEYTQSKYVAEQLTGAVKMGITFDKNDPPYFALNAVFLGNNNPNGLKGTTIILTGCNGTGEQHVIQRLFEKGVKTFISWNGYVDLSHSDEATLELVKTLYSEGLGYEEAVDKVNQEVGPDPFYKSKLVCNLA
jgi:hypothetical protein